MCSLFQSNDNGNDGNILINMEKILKVDFSVIQPKASRTFVWEKFVLAIST